MATKSKGSGNGSGKPAGVPRNTADNSKGRDGEAAPAQEIEQFAELLLSAASRFAFLSFQWAAAGRRRDYVSWLHFFREFYDNASSENSQGYSQVDRYLMALNTDGNLFVSIGACLNDFTSSCQALLPEEGPPLMGKPLMEKIEKVVSQTVRLSALLRHAGARGRFPVSARFRSKAKMIDEKAGGALARCGAL